MDPTRWRLRLVELADRHRAPGASLAVLSGEEVTALATGVLHTGTGVPATTDSLFQIGSITKVYTATVLMRLIDQTLATVDTPVVEILPTFRVADPEVTEQLTLRQLLTHSSGISGDFFHDTGCGDDCLVRYVRDCADLPQSHPLGATLSYCNTGYIIAGRVIEVLTGTVWDAALANQLADPLGLTHTWTLPEDVLRFRAAMGHLTAPDGGKPQPAPRWYGMRSVGPAGLVCATASDVVGLARLHLDRGRAADGTPVLSPSRVAEMQRPQVRMPNPHGISDHWGLGWALYDWDGRRVYGHDGDTIGQSAFLRVVPDAGVAVALLTNSDTAGAFHHQLITELLAELCDLAVPPPLQPPADPPQVDPHRHAGVYQRVGTRIEAIVHDGRLVLHVMPTGELAHLAPRYDLRLVPLAEDLFVGQPANSTRWVSSYFYPLPDGRSYLHDGSRATPRVG